MGSPALKTPENEIMFPVSPQQLAQQINNNVA